jgi:hypothetical protein
MIRKPKLKDFLPAAVMIGLTLLGVVLVGVGLSLAGHFPEGLIAMGLMLWMDMIKGNK